MNTPEHVEQYCKQFSLCKGCPFVGSECVAPEAQSRFSEWLNKMITLIEAEYSENTKGR